MVVPRTAEILRKVIDTRLQDLHTALPCEVVSFDATAQTVVVQPLVKSVVKDIDDQLIVEAYPQLRDVPVCWPRARDFIVAFPLDAGDMVTVLCHETDLGNFLETGTEGQPVLLERHGLSGAVALPFGPFPYAHTIGETLDGLVIGKDGGAVIRIKDDGTIQIGASGSSMQAVALADDVKAEINALRSTVNSLVTAYNAHVHTATGCLGNVHASMATPPAAVGDVGSSKAEVEE